MKFGTVQENKYILSDTDVIITSTGVVELTLNGSSSAAAVSFNGTYKLVYLTFPFETIDTSSNRNTLMSKALTFLLKGVVPVTLTPTPTPTPTPTIAKTTSVATPTPTQSTYVPTSTPNPISTSTFASTSTAKVTRTRTLRSTGTAPTPTSTPTDISSTPTPTPTKVDQEDQSSSGLTKFEKIITGIVVAGAFLIALVSVLTWFLLERRGRKESDDIFLGDRGLKSSTDEKEIVNENEPSLPEFLRLNYLEQIQEEKLIYSSSNFVQLEGTITDQALSVRCGFQKVAIKKIHLTQSEINNPHNQELFYKEISVMWQLAYNPNIVKIVGYCNEPRIIVTKRYQSNLFSYIHNQTQDMPLDLKISFVRGICLGLSSIHGLGFAHRCLSSSTILIDQGEDGSLVCVLSDLSQAVVVEQDLFKDTIKELSPRYSSPEVFQTSKMEHYVVDPKGEMKSDIYALGILVWEIATREVAWNGLKRRDIEIQLANKKRPEIPDHLVHEKKLYEIAQGCWRDDPSQRLRCSEILKILGDNQETTI